MRSQSVHTCLYFCHYESAYCTVLHWLFTTFQTTPPKVSLHISKQTTAFIEHFGMFLVPLPRFWKQESFVLYHDTTFKNMYARKVIQPHNAVS
jgi:hypothetical protein